MSYYMSVVPDTTSGATYANVPQLTALVVFGCHILPIEEKSTSACGQTLRSTRVKLHACFHAAESEVNQLQVIRVLI